MFWSPGVHIQYEQHEHGQLPSRMIVKNKPAVSGAAAQRGWLLRFRRVARRPRESLARRIAPDSRLRLALASFALALSLAQNLCPSPRLSPTALLPRAHSTGPRASLPGRPGRRCAARCTLTREHFCI
eukprot:scaffold31179_cov63-Phaeocystis_antarctica.AAC.1